MHGAGRQPQSKLERVAGRTVAESQYVMDAQRCVPDRRCLGGTAEQACLVMLCTLQRDAPVVEGGD